MTDDIATREFEAVLALTIHDIKNSLALLLEKLDQEGDEPAAGSAVSTRYEIKRINHNLIRLLGIYKAGVGGYRPQMAYQPASELVEEVAAEYAGMLAGRGIEVEFDCPPGLYGTFDKGLLFSVLENAVNNATRYARGRIAFRVAQQGERLCFRVEDDGDGYPLAMLDQFESLAASGRFDPAFNTTGLGHYFSLMVARMHRLDAAEGSIALTNGGEFGGSCFSICVPNSTEDDLF